MPERDRISPQRMKSEALVSQNLRRSNTIGYHPHWWKQNMTFRTEFVSALWSLTSSIHHDTLSIRTGPAWRSGSVQLRLIHHGGSRGSNRSSFGTRRAL